MPEGPEIRREADQIEAAVGGKETTKVEFGLEELEDYGPELTGRRVEEVTSRGKAILTRFDGDRVIYSHNQLYGKWEIHDAGERPDTNRQLRLVLETKDKAALLYSASEIDVFDADQLEEHPYLSKLGPDPLDDDVQPSDFAERLRSDDFRRRQLASVLLDQSLAAGLGNYLRAEILFEVGIHPKRRAADLDDETIDALAEEVVRVTRRSYESGGVANDPERVEKLLDEGRERDDVRFAVYKREGEPCFRCGTPIERMNAGGRRIFYCPECQPEDG